VQTGTHFDDYYFYIYHVIYRALQNEVYTVNSKFAIWGWSYGGYLSALALLNETTPFKCGVSGAPVTDWKLYGM